MARQAALEFPAPPPDPRPGIVTLTQDEVIAAADRLFASGRRNAATALLERVGIARRNDPVEISRQLAERLGLMR